MMTPAPSPPPQDSAAQRQAEAHLQERDEQLRLAQQAGGIGAFAVDIRTDVMSTTPEFCRIFGVDVVEAMPPRQIEALIVPEDAAIASSSRTRAEGTVPSQAEYRIRHAQTGELRWISRRAELVRDAEGRPVRLVGIVQDVTERRQAEDALRAANERVQLALNAGAVLGTWVWDIPAVRITVDALFAKSFGLTPVLASQEVTVQALSASIHPEDFPRVEALVSQTVEKGQPLRVEFRARQSHGAYLWLEANGHCEHDAQGKPLRFPGILLNIDERKRAELRQLALAELGERLRALDSTADIAAVAMEVAGRHFGLLRAGYGRILTSQGQLVIERDWVSGPEAAGLAGTYRLADLGPSLENLQRGEPVIIPDVEADPRTAGQAAALREYGVRALLTVPLLEQGHLAAVLYLHSPEVRSWQQEDIQFVHNVADRIWAASERVKVMADLRRANETLEQRVAQRTRERDRIWNVSQDLQLVTDFEGRILSANPAWTTILGWAPEELVGKTTTWLEHPEDQARTRAEVARLAEGHRVMGFENSMRHKDGSYRLLSWMAVPVPEDASIYAVARDITAQRHIEEQLRQAQKMEAVGNLTGGVAHDFNNLLQVIGGNLQLLEREMTAHERGLRRVQTALSAVDRGAKLASQLLAFSRRQPLQPLVLHLGRLVRGMDDLLRRALGEDVEVETVVTGGLWNTFADPNQLENVILNLAINARDAMTGHGRLTIEVHNAVLDEPYAQRHPEAVPGPYVMLAVSDTGSGMPPEVLARAFEPFFTTKSEGRGTGLGLSMVYGFVKQSGGHVKIYSELGHGTTVKVYLPRALQAEAPLAEPEKGPVEGGAETVLVVEDDAEVRATVVEMLSELGYRILKAVDAQSALAIVQSGLPVDLLLTDVVMPGPLRSPDMAREAKALLPDLEVLFTSGYSENAIVHGGRLDPGVHLLSKPYRREDLARKVRGLLNARSRRRESLASREAREPSRPGRARPQETPQRLRVLLVEDDADIRASASELLSFLGHEVLAVESAEEARGALVADAFDVLFTDATLPGMSGVDLAREAVRRRAGLRIIIASGHGHAALEDGGPRLDGVVVLPKPYALTQIQQALSQVLSAR
ncbi:PAS domain S-box-containing protein [Stigmatella aurantiaca]|uniref:histidine kinase n=1 Tax=Stigmatella aurantiaca TaxID=41 RepID=A0A1H7ZKZ5_STIAU|nr:PAS domain-containing protein [Stigmatella aurantiaca]SEM58159.1 PAS domain S-box-containing protein [Stigmatella aurantiaca]